ncbi:hypothetical protein P389DRAFT_195720 [Cystobasidium minutum MCA 4210]|uniref:uncharacterized protein n=1 Tax=Cystobasidium minutum MCA 4210 TaxID=1397322 RepID=UPI0034CE28A3|eukprot:jgi/Rhomi1/195720/gm1.3934_g
MPVELPPDVLRSIFQFVVDDPLGHNRPALGIATPTYYLPDMYTIGPKSIERNTYRTLTSAALVCRKWVAGAQEVLYEQVLLRTQMALELFLSTMKHRKDLARKVRKLAVDMYGTVMHELSVQTLLKNLPNMTHYQLYFHFICDGSERSSIQSYLPTIKNGHLTRLTLHSDCRSVPGASFMGEGLRAALMPCDLDYLPHSLERLDLISIDLPALKAITLPRLTTLTLNESAISRVPEDLILDTSNLLKIHLWYVKGGRSTREVLRHLLVRIKELHLLPRDDAPTRTRAGHLAHFLGDIYREDLKFYIGGRLIE